jgi:6-phosphogluconolactonase
MLWVGTYETKGGKGLYPLDDRAGRLGVGAPEPRIANASYGAWSPRTRTAYFVDEQDAGRVVAWGRRAHEWEARGAQLTGGSAPCYLSLDPKRGFVAVANYGDGSVGLLPLDRETGRIGELSDIARPTGRGVDPERQAGPHAHCVLFDETGEHLFHVDLGLDRIWRHRVVEGRLRETAVAFEAPPGSGPRHLMLQPDGRHALLLSELSGELLLLARRETDFALVHSIQTAPEPTEGNLGGHLAVGPDGLILVTNRGHDSLAAFVVADGRLEARGWVHTGAASPRHFHAGEKAVLVAHEEGETVTAVPLPDPDAKGLASGQSAGVPGAAFLIDIPD